MKSLEARSPWLKIHEQLGVSFREETALPLGAHIEENAEKIPDNTALVFFDREISYRELNEEANRFANALVALDIGKGDVVGVLLPNVPQYAFAVVALSKIGAILTGVSPLLAPSEAAYQIENSGASLLLALDALAESCLRKIEKIPSCLKTVVLTGARDFLTGESPREVPITGVSCKSYASLVREASTNFSQRPVSPEDIALYQYTGGTTGRPKGAMITVGTTLNTNHQAFVYQPLEYGRETFAIAYPYFHAAGLCGMIYLLRMGAKSSIIPDARDIGHFCEFMIKHPPTYIGAVPVLYQMIIEHPLSKDIDFSGLKLAMTGAAPITGKTRTAIEDVIGENKLSDTFGMTETGSAYIVNPPSCPKPEAVGIPLPNVDVRIVDTVNGTEEMPTGTPGEIICHSAYLMKGYLNLPDETERALRQWNGREYMYTGDVGYMDEDGYVFLCDRIKDMLIVGGYKVFSVEIEEKLAKLDFIARSAVVGTPDTERPGNDIVNLYVELTPERCDDDPAAIEDRIRQYCRETMARYKVPKVISIIDAIPLTSVGKLDKKVLRDRANRSR